MTHGMSRVFSQPFALPRQSDLRVYKPPSVADEKRATAQVRIKHGLCETEWP